MSFEDADGWSLYRALCNRGWSTQEAYGEVAQWGLQADVDRERANMWGGDGNAAGASSRQTNSRRRPDRRDSEPYGHESRSRRRRDDRDPEARYDDVRQNMSDMYNAHALMAELEEDYNEKHPEQMGRRPRPRTRDTLNKMQVEWDSEDELPSRSGGRRRGYDSDEESRPKMKFRRNPDGSEEYSYSSTNRYPGFSTPAGSHNTRGSGFPHPFDPFDMSDIFESLGGRDPFGFASRFTSGFAPEHPSGSYPSSNPRPEPRRSYRPQPPRQESSKRHNNRRGRESRQAPPPEPDLYKVDLYAILGVTEKATPEELKAAYRKLAMQFHPDRQPAHKVQQATIEMAQINRAYDILKNPKFRKYYDETGDIYGFEG